MGRLFNYKGLKVNHFGIPVSDRKEGIPNGKKRVYSLHRCFIHNFKNKAPKNLIVMYDIPGDGKSEREWLVRQLKKFDYIMVQKSVWVGPSPLPNDFLKYIKSIGLSKRLKTLKLAKPYSRNISDM